MRSHNLFGRFLVVSLALIIAWCAFAPAESSAQGGGLTVNLMDFGAVGDGATDDGPALQSALDAVAAAGGGTIEVPSGRFAIVTPVSKDFGGAGSLTIRGVESTTPVAPPTAFGNELSKPLDLVSEFLPKTGPDHTAVHVSGLDSFLVKDIAFVGTPDVQNDAYITLDITDVGQATIRHCEFYGLITQIRGGAIVNTVRSRLAIEQTKFLGSTGNSGVFVPAVQCLEWKDIRVENSIFIDYGQRPELFSKTGTAAAYSWLIIGNAAQLTPDSPRREVTIREVFLDEGAFNGLSAFPSLYEPDSAPVDLLYITGLYQNVANLGSSGHYLTDLRGVLIEKSHYGWSQRAGAAINLLSVGNAILDEIECVEDADRIMADAATGRLTVINSVYNHLDSQAQVTDVRQTATPEEDPVQYVRQQFVTVAGRVPDGAAHYYWSDLLLRCGTDAACLEAQREALDAYLNHAPSPQFAVGGQIVDEEGDAMPGITVALTGSQTVSTQTDAEGRYRFSGLPTSGVYNVTPTLRHHSFGPAASRTLNTPAGDVTADFVATFNHHNIRGRVTDAGGAAMSGVTVRLAGSATATATTGDDGTYAFDGLIAGGNYTVTPSRTSYQFAPFAQTFNDLDANRTLDFKGTFVTYSINGNVNSAGSAVPMGGVTITLSGGANRTATTDSNGGYVFTGLPSGLSYTVTPSLLGYSFAPASQTFASLDANRYAGFTATFTTHSVSGRVTNAGGAGVAGATVSLSGHSNATTTTNSNGNYSFAGLLRGANYTVTVSRANYTFDQPARTFNNITSNQTADFAGALNNYAVGGRVSLGGVAFSGVVVTLSGSQSAQQTTDSNGNYSFTLPAEGNYTLTPSKAHHTFAPPQLSFSNLGGNRTADFAGTLNRHTLSGRVVNVNNGAMPGVLVTLSGAQAATTTTDANGGFSFPNLAAGASYTVTPSLRNHTFAPASRTYNDLGSDQRGDFAGGLSFYQIGGRVTEKGAGLAGVSMTISVSGTQVAQTTTDAGGNYSFRVIAENSYTVAPAKENYTFDRAAAAFNNLSGDQVADFAATLRPVVEFGAASASVSEGVGVFEVTITRGGDTTGELTVVYAASDGTARQGLDLGTVVGQITFAPGETSKPVYVFVTDDSHVEGPETFTLRLTDAGGALLGNRSSTALTIQDNDQGSPAPNPVDDAEFFVRQHYRDFLGREPDAGGLAFWTNEITSCGTNAACVATKREDVSASFFLSIEFKETGYFVYRMYKASYGRMPRRVGEFLLDAGLIGEGVAVGAPGWDTRLAANKQAYLAKFVARPAFVARYPSTLTPAQFVSQLNANTGSSLTAEEAAALASTSFGGAADSSNVTARATALRRVADSAEFSRRELNRAFVLMQYFGYLQRNPDDPPDDFNLIGYNFWLEKLDDNGGNFVNAQMVKAFVDSIEYRNRFGR